MRATEITESQMDNLIQLATTAEGTWYETQVDDTAKHFKKINGSDKNVDNTPGIRYFVFVPKGSKTWSLASRIMMLKHHDLSGGPYLVTKQDGEDLQALADATQAQNGAHVYGDFLLYKGKVYPKKEFLSSLPVVAQIHTGAVHEVPSDALWTLNRMNLKYQTIAQRVVVFPNTTQQISDPWSSVSIRDGKISDIQSTRKLDKITQVKLGKEVAQALGLAQKVTVKTHLIPESKLHDVLRAVNDNPEIDRPKLYWQVLKLVKMPAYRSADDPLFELVKLGLVNETHKSLTGYYVSGAERTYSITPVGKLVLARLKSGKPVDKSSLIKP
jgi:hypothetical protein